MCLCKQSFRFKRPCNERQCSVAEKGHCLIRLCRSQNHFGNSCPWTKNARIRSDERIQCISSKMPAICNAISNKIRIKDSYAQVLRECIIFMSLHLLYSPNKMHHCILWMAISPRRVYNDLRPKNTKHAIWTGDEMLKRQPQHATRNFRFRRM